MMIEVQPGNIEGDDEEGALGLEDFGEHEKRGIFARYHNSSGINSWARIAL